MVDTRVPFARIESITRSREATTVRVYCPYYGQRHVHGLPVELPAVDGTYGHRLSHCGQPAGYYLTDPDLVVMGALRRQARLVPTRSDALGPFLLDRCVEWEGAVVTAGALYTAYERWCGQSGVDPVSRTAFGRALRSRGFTKVKHGTVSWAGLELLQIADQGRSRRRSVEVDLDEGGRLLAAIVDAVSANPEDFPPRDEYIAGVVAGDPAFAASLGVTFQVAGERQVAIFASKLSGLCVAAGISSKPRSGLRGLRRAGRLVTESYPSRPDGLTNRQWLGFGIGQISCYTFRL